MMLGHLANLQFFPPQISSEAVITKFSEMGGGGVLCPGEKGGDRCVMSGGEVMGVVLRGAYFLFSFIVV